MSETIFNHSLQITVKTSPVSKKSGDISHQVKVRFDGLNINLGTLCQLAKPYSNGANFIHTPADDPTDETQIIAADLSAAVKILVTMYLCR